MQRMCSAAQFNSRSYNPRIPLSSYVLSLCVRCQIGYRISNFIISKHYLFGLCITATKYFPASRRLLLGLLRKRRYEWFVGLAYS